MDALFKRYGHPFLFMDGMIRAGRFCYFVREFWKAIHEEENERGQFLKSISFRFPVYYNGKEIRRIEPGEDGHKKYADELTKENLEGWDKEKTDETVVLLTKTTNREA